MNKRMRRILTAVLVVVMVMQPFNGMGVRAITGGGEDWKSVAGTSSGHTTWAQALKLKSYGIFQDDGTYGSKDDLVFFTVDEKATSDIHWRTIGYTLTPEADLKYRPQSTYRDSYTTIPRKLAGDSSESLGGGKLLTKYTIKYKTVTSAIEKNKKLSSAVRKNEHVYLHMIGESYDAGTGIVRSTNLTSVATLLDAETWSGNNVEAEFQSHFNLMVNFSTNYVPEVKIKYVEYSSQFNGTEVDWETDNWKDLKSERVLESETNRKTVKLKDYLKESITDDNGETYLLSSIRYYAGDSGWQMMHSDHVMTMRKETVKEAESGSDYANVQEDNRNNYDPSISDSKVFPTDKQIKLNKFYDVLNNTTLYPFSQCNMIVYGYTKSKAPKVTIEYYKATDSNDDIADVSTTAGDSYYKYSSDGAADYKLAGTVTLSNSVLSSDGYFTNTVWEKNGIDKFLADADFPNNNNDYSWYLVKRYAVRNSDKTLVDDNKEYSDGTKHGTDKIKMDNGTTYAGDKTAYNIRATDELRMHQMKYNTTDGAITIRLYYKSAIKVQVLHYVDDVLSTDAVSYYSENNQKKINNINARCFKSQKAIPITWKKLLGTGTATYSDSYPGVGQSEWTDTTTKPDNNSKWSVEESEREKTINLQALKKNEVWTYCVGLYGTSNTPPPNNPDKYTVTDRKEKVPWELPSGWVSSLTDGRFNGVNNYAGVIEADSGTNRSASGAVSDDAQFKAATGIPTNKWVYSWAKPNKYETRGQVTYHTTTLTVPITVSKTYNVSTPSVDAEGNPITVVTARQYSKEINVVRTINYYTFESDDFISVYFPKEAHMENYSLPDGAKQYYDGGSGKNYSESRTVTLFADGNDAENCTVSVTHRGDSWETYVSLPPMSSNINTLNLPSGSSNGEPDYVTEFTREADNRIGNLSLTSNQDRVTFTAGSGYQTILNGNAFSKPSSNQDCGSRKFLYQDGLAIDGGQSDGRNKLNGIWDSENNTVTYVCDYTYNGSDSGTKRIYGMSVNSVQLHTPVICYPEIENITTFDQRVNPVENGRVLVLDRTFKIDWPYEGQHKVAGGYQYRSYKQFTDKRQVKFQFDVYSIKDGGKTFHPKEKWINVDDAFGKDAETLKFYLPTWVDERSYSVSYRTIALNTTNNNKTSEQQDAANFDESKYAAKRIDYVDVIGRLYNFNVFDVSDYPTWEPVFRKSIGSMEKSGRKYTTGKKNQNGDSLFVVKNADNF